MTRGTTKPRARRKQRSRPTPRWLTGRADLDQVAQRRCLLILSVLSGEKPVTAAIEEMQISRGFYYQLETKALLAMLRSVAPGSDGATTPDGATMSARVSELEARIAKLEQDKRRLERLLYLTRQILPTGPVALGPGRRKKTSNPTSTRAGSRGLPSSKRKLTIRRATSTPSTSTLTPAGGDEP